MAAGVFAPGHLGELTRVVPFELVDAVVEHGAAGRRLRLLPARVGVYFLLALGLFPQVGYLGVWAKLTAALDGLGLAVPSGRALRGLRRRLGVAPLRALFEILAGPHRILSFITREAVDEMGLKPGMLVAATVKATNVMVEVEA